jgi:putative chitinase
VNLSVHFSLAELVMTDTGLPNNPTPAEVGVLRATARQLEAVRALLGHPMSVTSAFRSDAVNKAVGGVPNSAHRLGYACDFTCAGFGDPFAVATKIAQSHIRFDQLIHERRKDGSWWVHISFDPRYRNQRLTLRADGGYDVGILVRNA